jgi:predicted TIM-barrel fold metal-dependent hydrolase
MSDWPPEVIDADVHIAIDSIESLYRYMPSGWVKWIEDGNFREPPTLRATYPPSAPTTTRAQWRPADGRVPASELALVREQLLDPSRAACAIVHPYWALESVRQPELASVLARAINDWMIAEWLLLDDRLRGTLTVVHHDPAEAVREIERLGGHPRIVQVALPVWSQLLWGKRLWRPLFDAIAAHDLVAAIHYGGTPDAAPTGAGWPSYHLEQHAAAPQIFFSQLVSMIGEGLFQAVPDLRVSLLESGFSWLPVVMWRMTAEWRGLRRDVPWLSSAPSDIVREHVRVSVAPLDDVPSSQLRQIIEWIGEDVLMYASDYPHGYDDDFTRHLDTLPEGTQLKIMSENARKHYRL